MSNNSSSSSGGIGFVGLLTIVFIITLRNMERWPSESTATSPDAIKNFLWGGAVVA